ILVQTIRFELRLSARIWDKTADSIACSHQIISAAGFEQIADYAGRQSLINTVVGEPVTVKARQSFRRAEPEEAMGIENYPVNAVTRQPIGNCVGLDRQSLGSGDRSSSGRQHQQDDKTNKPDQLSRRVYAHII